MALLDVLKATQQSRQPAANAAATPTAAELQSLAATKATGKAVAPTAAPATSNIAGQVAATNNAATAASTQQATDNASNALVQTAGQQQQAIDLTKNSQATATQSAIANLQTEQSLANTQRGVKEDMATSAVNQKVDLETKEFTNKYATAAADLASQRGIAENDIFQDYNQAIQQVGLEKATSNLEQTAHILAMSDAKYVDELKRVGMELNLQDDISFKREASTLALQKNLEILSKGFDMERLINADRRTFTEQMSTMDLNMALSIAAQAAKEAAAVQTISGVTNAVGAGAKAGVFDDMFSGNTKIESSGPTIDASPTLTTAGPTASPSSNPTFEIGGGFTPGAE